MATAGEDWMTDTDPPNQEGTDEAAETPTYKSPLEQILEKMPIFGPMFSSGSGKSGGGGSGKFELSIEEMERLRQFREEADALRVMRQTSGSLAQDLALVAHDPASEAHHKAAKNHFVILRDTIDEQYTFADKFAEAIDRVIKQKATEDDAATAEIARHEKALS